MLYRVLFGLIPTVLIAMVITGAMPVSNVVGMTGSDGVDNVAERVEDDKAKAAGQDRDKPYRARTAEGKVSERIGIISPGQIEMMEENMRAAEEMTSAIRQMEDDERRGIDRSKWEARPGGGSGGWGRQ